MRDDVIIEGSGSTAINTNGNTITISSSGSGGTIQSVENTNNTLDITNPNGPTATVNLKVPLTLSGSISSPLNIITANVTGNGGGLAGLSTDGPGVVGQSTNYWGVFGHSPNSAGIVGTSNLWVGVHGASEVQAGIWGKSNSGTGVYGESNSGYGIIGHSNTNIGVEGRTNGADIGYGTTGHHDQGGNVFGALGVKVNNYHYGVYGSSGLGSTEFAAFFSGNVYVGVDLEVQGNKNFKIDHPLDPANKYLIHSCVESFERMNIYNGNITTDPSGLAPVELPAYFEALNIDYRYQLTTIGKQAQAWVENEISNNHFTIRTDKPNIKVSWQVTGVRNDEHAKQNPFVVEKEKEEFTKGKYLRPELFNQPKEMGIHYVKNPYEDSANNDKK